MLQSILLHLVTLSSSFCTHRCESILEVLILSCHCCVVANDSSLKRSVMVFTCSCTLCPSFKFSAWSIHALCIKSIIWSLHMWWGMVKYERTLCHRIFLFKNRYGPAHLVNQHIVGEVAICLMFQQQTCLLLPVLPTSSTKSETIIACPRDFCLSVCFERSVQWNAWSVFA